MQISFINRIIGSLLLLNAKTGGITSQVDVVGMEHVERLTAEGKPLLWSAWHGQTMLLCIFMQQHLIGRRTTFLIPDDWRGQTLYHLLHNLGTRPYPVDLENKGFDTARKLAQLIRIIKKEGFDNFLAPDGPAGPSQEIKPGAFFVSQKIGAPILPIGAYGRSVYEVKRWDNYILPYPFARLSVVIEDPLTLPKEMAQEEKNQRLTDALYRATMRAKANFYAAYGSGSNH